MRFKLLLFLLLCCWPVLAEPTALLDGALTVEIPGALRALDQAAIQEMFADSRSIPGAVLATPDSETRVSLTHTQAPLSLEDLEATKVALKERMGDSAVWVRDEMLSIDGHPWFRLDYDMGVGAAAKREIIVGTSAGGRLLFMVIATPVEDLELLGGDLQAMLDSLRVAP